MNELDITVVESKTTNEQIKKYRFKGLTLYIAQVRRKCELGLRDYYNVSKKEN